MEPTEVLAVIAALLAGFVTGRRSRRDGEDARPQDAHANPLASGARGVARVATGAGGHVAGATGSVLRHAAAGAGDASGVVLDAGRGALAGAGFGLLQFRASRHLRRHPSRPSAEVPVLVLVTAGSRFHRPGCAHVGSDAREATRDEAVAEGRVPCRACNP